MHAIWSDIENLFFCSTLQDENAKINEELVATRTDLSAQLAQCQEVHLHVHVCVHYPYLSSVA